MLSFSFHRLVVSRIGNDLQNISITPISLTNEKSATKKSVTPTTQSPQLHQHGSKLRTRSNEESNAGVVAGVAKLLAQRIRDLSKFIFYSNDVCILLLY